MSTLVIVNTYTHSVTYVTDKLLNSIKNMIRQSGLSPEKLTSDWKNLERGISTWLQTQDLEEVHLEVYNPTTNALVGRWDFEIFYGYTGDGAFSVDTDAIYYAILKQGVLPATCNYNILTSTKPNRPDVLGWTRIKFRSTDGFVKQSIGTTIDGSGLSAGVNYWRKG